MTDLVSLVMTISTKHDTLLPAHTGRVVYGLFMRWLESYSESLAGRWRDVDGMKPYTCSNIIGLIRHDSNQRLLKAGQTAWFRITGLHRDISDMLLTQYQSPPSVIDLEGQVIDVVSMTTDSTQHTWAGTTTYHELSGEYLLGQTTPPRQFKFELASLTTFKQNQQTQPFPLPDLVFGSLAERWNGFSEIAINPDLRQYCRLGVVTNHLNLKSVSINPQIETEPIIIGAIGKVSYRTQSYDRYWQSMLALLTRYAFYSGVGRHTTHGMGQARQQFDEPLNNL